MIAWIKPPTRNESTAIIESQDIVDNHPKLVSRSFAYLDVFTNQKSNSVGAVRILEQIR